ncbi:AGAP006194-PA [Anopheles gambiae str. PEST]|uniref:AGAP006194-PA n=1 Tax=Anopheles gambiae TaxID=7165 RepID=Q7Q5V1_ANOGA|nr:AGAP006194-PA [Anopheles gambiae str. PEST]
MSSLKGVPIIVFALVVGALASNSFNIIRDCKQYNGAIDYNGPVSYFPTSNLQHVRRTDRSKVFKFAVLGPMDGHLRFGRSQFPYDSNVIEIVLGGWRNSKSAGRRQYRTAGNRATNNVLVEVQTPNLLSPFHPLMFVLEVFNEGRVEVRIDGQPQPFLSFQDSSRIPANYMAFNRWERELIYFYDCPF